VCHPFVPLQRIAVMLRHPASCADEGLFVDRRTKVVESIRRGSSKSETARRFGFDRSTVKRYVKRLDESGSPAPKRRLGKHPKLNQRAMWLLNEDLEVRPWATHKQRGEFLSAICGVRVSEATICRAIKRLGHSRKQDRPERANGTGG
jgi:transposase